MEAKKHHYVPKCYLKGWTGADGLLCEYRKHQDRAIARRKHPSQTGWVDRLYELKKVDPDKRDIIERVFFQRVDQEASDALDALRRGQGELPDHLRQGLARFMMSLLHRHPSQIAHLRNMADTAMWDGVELLAEAYAEQRRPEDPPTIEEYRELHRETLSTVLFGRVLQHSCNSEKIGNHLMNMHLEVVTFWSGDPLITSDRPLLLAEGLGSPNCVILLPIAPRRLLVATNGAKAKEVFNALTEGRPVVPFVNWMSARQAHKYVYGLCENHLQMVEREMAKGLPPPWRNLIGQLPGPAQQEDTA